MRHIQPHSIGVGHPAQQRGATTENISKGRRHAAAMRHIQSSYIRVGHPATQGRRQYSSSWAGRIAVRQARRHNTALVALLPRSRQQSAWLHQPSTTACLPNTTFAASGSPKMLASAAGLTLPLQVKAPPSTTRRPCRKHACIGVHTIPCCNCTSRLRTTSLPIFTPFTWRMFSNLFYTRPEPPCASPASAAAADRCAAPAPHL